MVVVLTDEGELLSCQYDGRAKITAAILQGFVSGYTDGDTGDLEASTLPMPVLEKRFIRGRMRSNISFTVMDHPCVINARLLSAMLRKCECI